MSGMLHWDHWFILAFGAVCAALLFAVGRRLFGRHEEEMGYHADGSLADPLARRLQRERRRATRRDGNPVVVLISNADGSSKAARGLVLNRSDGGLRLQVDAALAKPGERLTVRPAQASAGTPWIPIEVRGCENQETHFELSCQFLQAVPYRVLLLFG